MVDGKVKSILISLVSTWRRYEREAFNQIALDALALTEAETWRKAINELKEALGESPRPKSRR
jgi:hypothetical protein